MVGEPSGMEEKMSNYLELVEFAKKETVWDLGN